MEETRPLHQIKASAGSGKTWTLTDIFLRYLARMPRKAAKDANAHMPQDAADDANGRSLFPPKGDDWRGIMAITFTNAAANEMQKRVLKHLKLRALEMEGKELNGMTAEAASFWVDHIIRNRSSLNISTIDSLLNLIVRVSALPLELPPDFTPVFTTEEVLSPHLDAMVNEAWSGDAELQALFRAVSRNLVNYGNVGGFNAGEIITGRLQRLFPMLYHDRLSALSDPGEFAKELESLRDTLTAELTAVLDGANQGIVYKVTFQKALEELLLVLTGNDYRHDFPVVPKALAERAAFRNAVLDTKKGSAVPGDAIKASFQTVLEGLTNYRVLESMRRQTMATEPLVRLAEKAFARYGKSLQEQGKVPNDMIPVYAKRALSGEMGYAEAICRLGNRLKHFLIDEFQDTSREHWRAMRPLVENAIAEGGTFTWVGDVKQSIYGFRGGDSMLFDEVADRESPDGLPVESQNVFWDSLDLNWRSRKAIINFNNALFAPLEDVVSVHRLLKSALDHTFKFSRADVLGEDANREIPELRKLQLDDYYAVRIAHAYCEGRQDPTPKKHNDGGAVHLLTFPKPEKDEENPEDAAILALIRRKTEQGTEPRKLLVLVRKNAEATDIAEYLAANGIAVVTENSLLLGRNPFVVQAVALLRFLANPEDNVAFWTLVSGSILADARGITRKDADSELVALMPRFNAPKDERGSFVLSRAWREASGDNGRFWDTHLAPLLGCVGISTPYDMVSAFFEHEGVLVKGAAQAEGGNGTPDVPEESDVAPFLRRFLEILWACQSSGIRSLPAFLDFWDNHGANEKVPMPESLDAVKIMTTHKAKGLEASVVIVPRTSSRQTNFADLDIISYRSPVSHHTYTALCRKERLFPQGEDTLLRESFEAINRFYVAFTRAKDELFVFLSETPAGEGKLLEAMLATAGEDGKDIPERLSWEDYAGKEGLLPGEGEGMGAGEGEGTTGEGTLPAAPVAAAFADTEDWEPLSWMPELRTHRDNQTPSSPRKYAIDRGILVHRVLESLAPLTNRAAHVETVLDRVLKTMGWLREDNGFDREKTIGEIKHFVELDFVGHWMDEGFTELPIVPCTERISKEDRGGKPADAPSAANTEGDEKTLRLDLLVREEGYDIIVDYKHGEHSPGLRESYVNKMRVYQSAFPKDRHPIGVICYLSERSFTLVLPDGQLKPNLPAERVLSEISLAGGCHG